MTAQEFAEIYAGRRVRSQNHQTGHVQGYRPSTGKVICVDDQDPECGWENGDDRIATVMNPHGGFHTSPADLELMDVPAAPVKDDRYPHVCPTCRGPAYIGLQEMDCKKGCR